VALYLGLAGGVGWFLITRLGAHSTWVTVGATLAAVAVFVPVRDKVQRIVDGRFFRLSNSAAGHLRATPPVWWWRFPAHLDSQPLMGWRFHRA
jgi:hypothetical protein